MSDRNYLSIGEVLALLLDEFPDITISKIRFLESQGLIEPERTPSGYRKFSTSEVERLKFILREQRENFLPLRVIRDRLDETGDITREYASAPDTGEIRASGHPAARATVPRGAATAIVEQDPVAPEADRRALRREAKTHADKTESLPRDEVLSQYSITDDMLKGLEAAGLVDGHDVGDTTFFDQNSIEIARAAQRFQELGIDIRHLRAWKLASDKEVTLFEQRILPLLRQRNPGSRDEALAMLDEFVTLGGRLRLALLAKEVQRLTDGR
jgi:DNA-binding transcriptional MerR regulator